MTESATYDVTPAVDVTEQNNSQDENSSVKPEGTGLLQVLVSVETVVSDREIAAGIVTGQGSLPDRICRLIDHHASQTPSAPAEDDDDPEALDIECEIRARHQPILHSGQPCPTGTCCSCGAEGGCEVGTALGFLDVARSRLERVRGETPEVTA